VTRKGIARVKSSTVPGEMDDTATTSIGELSLRERKKIRTRRQIADAAAALFAAKGYDAVTVAEIARLAEVSEQTVYNFFPSKEQLVLDEDAAFHTFLVGLVRDRPAGTPLADAVRTGAHRFLDDLRRRPKGAAAGTLPYLINTSAALRRAWLEALDRYAGAIADILLEDGDDAPSSPVAKVLAFAIVAVFHVIIDEIGQGMKRGTKDWRVLTRPLRLQIDDAVDRMAHTLNSDLSA
jgi:AcrR family transcriptional regulator